MACSFVWALGKLWDKSLHQAGIRKVIFLHLTEPSTMTGFKSGIVQVTAEVGEVSHYKLVTQCGLGCETHTWPRALPH